MRNNFLKTVLTVNALIWILLSAVNYIGIMQQLKEEIMSIFLWSIFTIMMYGVIIYSLSLVITRLYYIYQFRNKKSKYINVTIFRRELFVLTGAILYLYGVCYYNSHFLGLIPMFLFFGKALTNTGKFYVYENERLFLIEDGPKEYCVKDINLYDGKIVIQEVNPSITVVGELAYKLNTNERKFLTDLFYKEMDEKEVA